MSCQGLVLKAYFVQINVNGGHIASNAMIWGGKKLAALASPPFYE
jgi:hypothetical protein